MTFNDSLCKSQLNYIADALKNQENWAVRVFDFATRLPAEIYNQNIRRYELFGECLGFRHETFSVGTIQGQYCAVSGESQSGGPKFDINEWNFELQKSKKSIKFESGLCMPTTCDDQVVRNYIDSILNDVNLEANRVFCEKTNDVHVSWLDYFVILLLVSLVLLAAMSTFYEIKSRNRRKRSPLLAFSLFTNIKELIRIDYSQKSIECINGLRSIAAIWVIVSHRLSRASEDPNFFLVKPVKDDKFLFEMIWHTSIPVDVFVFISALLATQSCLRALEKHRFNYAKFCVHRYVRYAPSALVLVLIIVSCIPFLLISGPSINVLNEQVERCDTYWWSTLLMLQNYVNTGGSCIPPAWYLCVDYQLYVITPILVYIVWKFGFKSFWMLGALIFGTQSYLFYMRYNDIVSNHAVYTKTHFRFGQWNTGIIFGYIMHVMETSSPRIEISKRTRRIVWILVPIGLVVSQKSLTYFFQLPDAFYQAIQDILFMCFLGWTIITFHIYKSGYILRWFLSHALWQPFAKLTLSTFLVHDVYIFMSIANTKSPAHYEFGWLMLLFARDVVISTLLGALLYLFVEVPAAKLVDYYLNAKNQINASDKNKGSDEPLHSS